MPGTGFFAGPKETLAAMLAATTAFQTFTGAANATAARDYIHLYEADPHGQTAYAMIGDHPNTGRFNHVGAGSGVNNFRWTYGTTFGLFKNYATTFGETNALDFDNQISAIIVELLATQRTVDYRPIDVIDPVPVEDGDYLMQAILETDDDEMRYVYGRIFRESYSQG